MGRHYQTGEAIPDAMIEKIIALQQFDRGWFWQRQAFLATISIEYFLEGAQKDIAALWRDKYAKIIRNGSVDNEVHQFTSFGHLIGYDARYYSYIWSEVLSLDIFDYLKKQGLLQPRAGKRYVECVLSKGGSKEPEQLLLDFFGRESNNKAFLAHTGLN
jgi:Zn-dependent oligopeptidase